MKKLQWLKAPGIILLIITAFWTSCDTPSSPDDPGGGGGGDPGTPVVPPTVDPSITDIPKPAYYWGELIKYLSETPGPYERYVITLEGTMFKDKEVYIDSDLIVNGDKEIRGMGSSKPTIIHTKTDANSFRQITVNNLLTLKNVAIVCSEGSSQLPIVLSDNAKIILKENASLKLEKDCIPNSKKGSPYNESRVLEIHPGGKLYDLLEGGGQLWDIGIRRVIVSAGGEAYLDENSPIIGSVNSAALVQIADGSFEYTPTSYTVRGNIYLYGRIATDGNGNDKPIELITKGSQKKKYERFWNLSGTNSLTIAAGGSLHVRDNVLLRLYSTSTPGARTIALTGGSIILEENSGLYLDAEIGAIFELFNGDIITGKNATGGHIHYKGDSTQETYPLIGDTGDFIFKRENGEITLTGGENGGYTFSRGTVNLNDNFPSSIYFYTLPGKKSIFVRDGATLQLKANLIVQGELRNEGEVLVDWNKLTRSSSGKITNSGTIKITNEGILEDLTPTPPNIGTEGLWPYYGMGTIKFTDIKDDFVSAKWGNTDVIGTKDTKLVLKENHNLTIKPSTKSINRYELSGKAELSNSLELYDMLHLNRDASLTLIGDNTTLTVPTKTYLTGDLTPTITLGGDYSYVYIKDLGNRGKFGISDADINKNFGFPWPWLK